MNVSKTMKHRWARILIDGEGEEGQRKNGWMDCVKGNLRKVKVKNVSS